MGLLDILLGHGRKILLKILRKIMGLGDVLRGHGLSDVRMGRRILIRVELHTEVHRRVLIVILRIIMRRYRCVFLHEIQV